jgi:L-ascorbate metabolism protein UlaG (beta-lactamase superfamily)
MKITKYVHSCLVLEDTDYVAVIDPGEFSWQSGLFSVDSLPRLDDIIITHEHSDHMYMPFIDVLRDTFPGARMTGPVAVAGQLANNGIEGVLTKSHDDIELLVTEHESLKPLGERPEHTGVHVRGILTHPGDSHHFTETRDILALPVQAPWGSMMNAAALGLSLHPKYIVPIHDWHWNETARQGAYERLAQFYAEHGVTFIKPQDGVAFEI